jgi:DNA-binding GntR family transcriptional regulator
VGCDHDHGGKCANCQQLACLLEFCRATEGTRMVDGSQALERTTLRDRAEHSLRELIVGGDLAPGERINEVAVAAELGISRGPLREAIQKLVHDGLVEIISHRGAFVHTVDAAMLRDLYEVRAALETYAVKLLAGLPRSPAVATLADLVEQAEGELAERDGYPNDADFHRGLFAAIGNSSLTSAAEDIQTRISVARARSAREPKRAVEALAEHRAILDAIGGGRADEAARLMEQHLWTSCEHALIALGR